MNCLQRHITLYGLLVVVVLLVALNFPTAVRASSSDSLAIRVSKSYVLPGESYLLYATQKSTGGWYTGNLEVTGQLCNAMGGNCVSSQGPWNDFSGNIIQVNGTATVAVPTTAGAGVFVVRFRPLPNPNNYAWSNEIHINVGTTARLENSRDWWVYWQSEKIFSGRNYTYGEDFKTYIGFGGAETICGAGQVRAMTFRKNNIFGYWNPAVPYYNLVWSGTPNWEKDPARFDHRFKSDLRWFLVDWSRQPNWIDTWLTAYGHKTYEYLTNTPFTQWKVSYRFGSLEPTVPNYYLVPEYVGNGWGLGTNKALSGAAQNPTEVCNVTLGTTTSIWSVHADLLNLTTPKGTYPALKLKYYEGSPQHMNGGNFLREDWWFVKGEGLVKIDTKNFGTTPSIGRSSCAADLDCIVNDVMASPHVSLLRDDFTILPSQTPVNGDYTADAKVDFKDLKKITSGFEDYTLLDYTRVVRNYGN